MTFGSKKNDDVNDTNEQSLRHTMTENMTTRMAFKGPNKGRQYVLNMQNIDEFVWGIAPMMIQRIIEYDHSENWDDGAAKYGEYDIITRRYLEYCLMTGQDIEDYVAGLR